MTPLSHPVNSKSEDAKAMILYTVIVRHISTKIQQLNFQDYQLEKKMIPPLVFHLVQDFGT